MSHSIPCKCASVLSLWFPKIFYICQSRPAQHCVLLTASPLDPYSIRLPRLQTLNPRCPTVSLLLCSLFCASSPLSRPFVFPSNTLLTPLQGRATDDIHNVKSTASFQFQYLILLCCRRLPPPTCSPVKLFSSSHLSYFSFSSSNFWG